MYCGDSYKHTLSNFSSYILSAIKPLCSKILGTKVFVSYCMEALYTYHI